MHSIALSVYDSFVLVFVSVSESLSVLVSVCPCSRSLGACLGVFLCLSGLLYLFLELV